MCNCSRWQVRAEVVPNGTIWFVKRFLKGKEYAYWSNNQGLTIQLDFLNLFQSRFFVFFFIYVNEWIVPDHMLHMVPIKLVFIQMFFISTTKSWVLRWQRQVEIGKESLLPVCLWQCLKAHSWKSSVLFTHSYIPFSKTETESQLTLST